MKTEYYESSFALLLFLLSLKETVDRIQYLKGNITTVLSHIWDLSFINKKIKIQQSLIFNFQRNNFQISYL